MCVAYFLSAAEILGVYHHLSVSHAFFNINICFSHQTYSRFRTVLSSVYVEMSRLSGVKSDGVSIFFI